MTENTQYAKAAHTWNDPWDDDKEITCEYQFRKPSRSEISRFSKEAGKSSTNAQNNLLMSIVHPDDADRLKSDLNEYPALLATLGGWVLKASGFSDLGN